jgi:hypothetical protein
MKLKLLLFFNLICSALHAQVNEVALRGTVRTQKVNLN